MLFRRNEIILFHLAEDCFLTGLGCLRIGFRVVVVRALGDAGNHSGLGKIQIFNMFPKVGIGCRFDPVGPLTEVNLVHVHFQNFLFGVLLFNLECNEGFVDLSRQRPFLRKEVVFGQLLGNGTAALDLIITNVGVDGAGNPFEVNSAVLVKADVFSCKERVLQVFRYLTDGNGDTVFFGINGRNQVAIDVIELGRRHGHHIF